MFTKAQVHLPDLFEAAAPHKKRQVGSAYQTELSTSVEDLWPRVPDSRGWKTVHPALPDFQRKATLGGCIDLMSITSFPGPSGSAGARRPELIKDKALQAVQNEAKGPQALQKPQG